MAYEGFLGGMRADGNIPEQLVPLSQSLIPPHVALAFGIPSFGALSQQPALALPQQQLPQTHSLYGGLPGQGMLGFGGPQFSAPAPPPQFPPGLAPGTLGYLHALAAAGQQHHQQQQQQQQSAALAVLQAQSAALAASRAAASAPTPSVDTSGTTTQPQQHQQQQQQPASRAAVSEADRPGPQLSGATSSGVTALKPTPTYNTAASNASLQQALLQSMYAAALSQPHNAFSASPAQSYASNIAPYAGHLHAPTPYYPRPDNSAAAAVAAAAAAAAAYGYPPSTSTGTFSGFHSGYGGGVLDYPGLPSIYRPVALPATAPAPSQNLQSQSVGDDDCADDGSTRAIKRQRLVWTPQLHKKFESAVNKLGVERAVPKNIMQEMNIDGLTRENVASHLQKYRMLRRKDATSSEGRDSDTTMRTAGTVGSKRSEPSEPAPPQAGPRSGSGSGSGLVRTAGGGGSGVVGSASPAAPAPMDSPGAILVASGGR